MQKVVILNNKRIVLVRVEHGYRTVWANNPKKALRDLKRIAAERKKMVKTMQKLFNIAFAKKGGSNDE